MQCQSAIMRIKQGKSGYGGEDHEQNVVSEQFQSKFYVQGQRVFDVTSKLITAIDYTSLNSTLSVDQTYPYVRDVQTAINNYPNLPQNYVGIAIMKKWTEFFQSKQVTDDIAEGDLRQLKFDLELMYSQFNEVLARK